jgi:hypothetical protein
MWHNFSAVPSIVPETCRTSQGRLRLPRAMSGHIAFQIGCDAALLGLARRRLLARIEQERVERQIAEAGRQ